MRRGKSKSARFLLQHNTSSLGTLGTGSQRSRSTGRGRNTSGKVTTLRVYQGGSTFSLKHSVRIVATDTDETVVEEGGSDLESNGPQSLVGDAVVCISHNTSFKGNELTAIEEASGAKDCV